MADECLQEFFILFVCCLFVGPVYLETKTVKIKIVDEPTVYRGVNSFYQQHQQAMSNTKDLEPRVDPIPFAGPPHFSVLNGKCFSLIENSYKYELCPFHNVTQREQTVRWNAFSGILGVFQGWDIINNTFIDMLMDEGDYCPGNNPRQTKVLFNCGSDNKLISVSEPATCRYQMNFETPLACPQDALLVYPVLSTDGRSRWEAIEEGLWRDELTRQGYDKHRKQLFISQGLISSGEKKTKEVSSKRKGETEKSSKDKKTDETMPFRTLELCSKAYKELQSEVKRLKQNLNLTIKQQTNNINDDTTATSPVRLTERVEKGLGPDHNETQSEPSKRTKLRKESTHYLNTKRKKAEKNTNGDSIITKSIHNTDEFQKFKDAAKRKGKIIQHERNSK